MSGIDPYAGAHLEQALAEDPETAELGVRVIVDGQRLVLRGEVATSERRDHLAEVARRLEPAGEVVNEVTVTSVRTPGDNEREVL